MACFVPFQNRNLDVNFLVFRPTVVFVDDLVASLKQFSLCAETLGCVHSALLRSIHGNMIIWYGAWMKISNGHKEFLNSAFLSMLADVSSMAILIDHSFYKPYAGDSRHGAPAAKFYTGDTVSMNVATLATNKISESDLSYACLAIFKSCFGKMDGASAGVCLKCENMTPRVITFIVWKSLHSCYSWILNVDYRKTILPYLGGLSIDLKYDIFRVVYVCSDSVLNFQFCPPYMMLENEVESKESHVLQD